MSRFVAAFVLVIAACGDDGTSVDAPPAANVAAVDCASNAPTQTITATGTMPDGSDGKFMPMSVTITKGQVVKFVMSQLHNMAPNTGTDPALTVNFGETKCFKFNAAGTYNFHCTPHGFQGSVVVN